MIIEFKVKTPQLVNGYKLLANEIYQAKSEDYVRQGGERVYFLHLVITHPKGIKQGICPLPMWNKLNEDDLIVYISAKPELESREEKIALKKRKKIIEEKDFQNGFYSKNRNKDSK